MIEVMIYLVSMRYDTFMITLYYSMYVKEVKLIYIYHYFHIRKSFIKKQRN